MGTWNSGQTIEFYAIVRLFTPNGNLKHLDLEGDLKNISFLPLMGTWNCITDKAALQAQLLFTPNGNLKLRFVWPTSSRSSNFLPLMGTWNI